MGSSTSFIKRRGDFYANIGISTSKKLFAYICLAIQGKKAQNTSTLQTEDRHMHQQDTVLNGRAYKAFLADDFLLDNDVAAALYHDHAARMPIIDYHNHLPPADIANNRQFRNITEIWLEGDHYKWRAMRTNGVQEHFITGAATPWEKFEQWANTVTATMRNPLFHWTHLELRRYFGIEDLLRPQSARQIFEQVNEVLAQPDMSTQGILRNMNVEMVCTTDDPIDSLEYHKAFAQKGHNTQMLPAFRPDKAILIENDVFVPYIKRLEAVCSMEIKSYFDLLDALHSRMDFFAAHGCHISDHGLERIYAVEFTETEADRILRQRLNGLPISAYEAEVYQSAILYALGVEYAQRGWVQQYHLGALRNNNSRLLAQLGPDTGWDSIGDFPQAVALSRFLNRLDKDNLLAKTILYNLNPADNEVFATMIGNFNDGSVAGKVQWGSGWWFLDQKDGMEKQLNTLSNMSLLGRFVGMLTDSRSFMSFPRHEYFRRILCNMIGRDVQNGELPHDHDLLAEMVENICYYNAKRYFNV
jgi:glucuronate isomerase